MTITIVGVDIAKSAFQVHGVDSAGTVVLQKRISRNTFLAEMARLPRCVISPRRDPGRTIGRAN